MKRVLFLTHTPFEGPSSRVRVFQFLPFLRQYGMDWDVLPALPSQWFRRYYLDTSFWGKAAYFGRIFLERLRHLLRLKGYDAIFLQREVLPYFPPVFERMIRKSAKRLIFDFDDAIYLSRAKGRLAECHRRKINRIISWSDLVIAGNETLASYARAYHSWVEVLPSAVDTERYAPKSHENVDPVIVWLGTPSSAKYLRVIADPFKELFHEIRFRLRLIGAKPDFMNDDWVEDVPWDYETEVPYLQSSDVGIMPLWDGERERGKCGYKLLQYMACGLAVIASPVGVNTEIVKDGYNGSLVEDPKGWRERTAKLLKDVGLRKKFGQQAREDVELKYSLHQTLPKFVDLLRKALA